MGRVRQTFFVYSVTCVYSIHDTRGGKKNIALHKRSIILRPFRNKLSVLDPVQKSSCTLRLQSLLIDFQPGTTSRKHYATGLGPKRGPGAACGCKWRDLQLNLFSAEWSLVVVCAVNNILSFTSSSFLRFIRATGEQRRMQPGSLSTKLQMVYWLHLK